MKLIVKPRSETPIYEQLYDQIVANILGEEILAHQCLPSIRLVARELDISVVPVKAAYDLLEKNGYIYTLPGKGCFVAQVETHLKKTDLALEKMQECVNFCKETGMNCEEFLNLAKKCFQKNDVSEK